MRSSAHHFSAFALTAAIGCAFPFVGTAQGMLIFDETASGDLSSNPLLPTMLGVGVGSNFITADVDKRDHDYFSLVLPQGTALVAVILRESMGTEATFLSLQSGPTFTEPPIEIDYRNLLGYASFFAADIGTDLFPRLGNASDAIGFKTPLTENMYTFWVSQSNPGATRYKFEFVVEDVSVPTPGSIVAAAAGLLYAIPRPRRRDFVR